jgi:quercetin dioxygenase-like cupin family protein
MTTAGTAVPIIRARTDGERRLFCGGGVHTWKATAEETNGAYILFEMELERGKVTPLHSHPDSDETMFVLEGQILVHVDGVEHRIEEGGLVMAPRGVPHAFLVSSSFARVLCLHTPGSCQAFYLDASEPLAREVPPTEGLATVDFARIHASAERNGGIVLLGPPPFAAAQPG